MKFVGTSIPIHDAEPKAAGQAIFAGDMSLPRMAHCAVLFSTIPHGFVKKIDTSKALAMPGVLAVLDCFNTTNKKYNRFRSFKGQTVIEQEQVFNSHVRFVGDRVACVVAETAIIARKAVRLIEVMYEPLDFATDISDAMSGKIHNIHDDGAVYGDFKLELGDKTELSAEEIVEVTTRSRLARISHVTMEPHACVASYDKHSKELTVWSPNQSVHGIRTVMADLFDLPYERVRVIKTTMGGSFGAKQEWILEPVAIAAALKVGRPVKLVYNRGEAMVSTISRSPIDASFKLTATKDGRICGADVDLTLDAGAYLGNSYDYIAAIGSKFYRCYKFPYVNYTARAVCTNTSVSGAFRGWSAPEMAIMLEHAVNMTARRLGMDSLELRLKNMALPGDVDLKNGIPLGEIRIKECITTGREKFEYDKKRHEDLEFNKKNRRYKRGTSVGCGGHVNGYFPRLPEFCGVDMRMTESGGVILNCTVHDHGCGSVTVMKMIAGEALGIPPDLVQVREGDSSVTPFDMGCYASRTTYVIGRAVMDCAEKLKQSIIADIAEIHGVDHSDIEIKDGCVLLKKDDSCYTYGEAAVKIMMSLQKEVSASHKHVGKTNPGVGGAHFARVEVDTLTGMVKILDYLAVHDVGLAINREICKAQIQGAVVMGCGAALTEQLAVNPKTGRTTNSMKNYHLINMPEVPDIGVEFVEDGGTEGPYGAKSIGEVSMVPVAPAVIGAVNEALQSELCVLPLNPDSIMEYLGRAGNSEIYSEAQEVSTGCV